ncbi:hypothetical protein [Bacillus toyonensis]|uniref:hypothetical protein n=1 Tax=Bacillus toyonensis TaxID=155322 RepID=UPI003689EB30
MNTLHKENSLFFREENKRMKELIWKLLLGMSSSKDIHMWEAEVKTLDKDISDEYTYSLCKEAETFFLEYLLIHHPEHQVLQEHFCSTDVVLQERELVVHTMFVRILIEIKELNVLEEDFTYLLNDIGQIYRMNKMEVLSFAKELRSNLNSITPKEQELHLRINALSRFANII